MKVCIDTQEWYPVRTLAELGLDPDRGIEVEVEPEVHARWLEVFAQFKEVQREMSALVDPPCPECGHSLLRHQEWSQGWGYWGCLASGCRCQHGIPEERKEEDR